MKESIAVFLDSGLQTFFVPLIKPDNFPGKLPPGTPDSLVEACEKIDQFEVPEATRQDLLKREADMESDGPGGRKSFFSYSKIAEPYYIRYRLGRKVWTLPNGSHFYLLGLWLLVETNTSAQDGNAHGVVAFDRGYVYQKDIPLTDEEQKAFEEEARKGLPYHTAKSPYIPCPDGKYLQLKCFPSLDLGKFELEVIVRKPVADPCEVDLVLDVGNTRSAGLLFNHEGQGTFPPDQFRSRFKVLRLDPDPASGEYDSINDVNAGIAESWMVLHELEHQTYRKGDESKAPDFLQKQYVDIVVDKIKPFLGKTRFEFKSGSITERIPQMFMKLSPVIIGQAARQQFNEVYTSKLVEMGLRLQQSSPKRYFWDDTQSPSDWCMILNEWDPSYTKDPEKASRAPVVQGEMFRFISPDGKILELSKDIDPADRPSAYPDKGARYPRQSTLTWFLLHLLERANSQINRTFASGAAFVPHRLRKVLMTYPSGWTESEIEAYRERCNEALNIFSTANVYHGLENKELCLEMVKSENSPDEAVAGQLPFVFSEILRYPGQTANDWISTIGKMRDGQASVRIMNFDIGGGTTDISIIEYRDRNETQGVAQTVLSTRLLFKDGQSIAGDDLLRQIIEKLILGPLSELHGIPTLGGEDLGKTVVQRFSIAPTDDAEAAVRSRVTRTCLIPLAIYCLSHSGQQGLRFSARDAGINQNNWEQFQKFLNADPQALPHDSARFACDPSILNGLMENTFSGLFENCAMYASAYDIDLLVFSGKTSEQSYIREMAEKYIPLSTERLIFARSFKPGNWYPFLDANGFIKDAKTVTVVGAALYYALSQGFITNWTVRQEPSTEEVRYDWGEWTAIRGVKKSCLLPKDQDEVTVPLLPNSILARRQNICSTPEPVYKLVRKDGQGGNDPIEVTLRRVSTPACEKLELVDSPNGAVSGFELKLWPSAEGNAEFWQESGVFKNIG